MKPWVKYILSCIWSLLLVLQIVLLFVFGQVNEDGSTAIIYVGWATWALSVIFGWFPILILKKKGGVAKGKSYVKTTLLVDTGIYSIIRHPQYTAGILFSLALILISQTWLVAAIGFVAILLMYVDILMADKYEVEKFGDDYRRYMERVPRTNFILGILRKLRHK